MSDNPLSQYFRAPSIYVGLPSEGKFYPTGTVDIPPNGEVPVFPMTALDEITYKTPDALFNGTAIADVIKSCVPAIKDPWAMPVTDLTSILLAIRIASFGHEMEIETRCPKCGNTADYGVDLRVVLDSVELTDYTKTLDLGDLKLQFMPMSYKDLNENSMLQFEEAKLQQMLTTSDMDPDQQVEMLSAAYKKISKLTISTLSKNIAAIITPDATVSEPAHILEFLHNCERDIYKTIKDTVMVQKSKEVTKPLQIECHAHVDDDNAPIPIEGANPIPPSTHVCGHKYEQPFTLDMTSFFAPDS